MKRVLIGIFIIGAVLVSVGSAHAWSKAKSMDQWFIGTSSDRPTCDSPGKMLFETDTKDVWICDSGGNWNLYGPGEAKVTQATHDNLNANANLQVGDADVSATNPVPIKGGAIANTTKLSPTGGSKTVAASGTGEALVAASTLKTTLYVRAKSTNTGNIYLGDSATDESTSQQIILAPGQEVSIEAPAGYHIDINEWYIDADVSGEGVDFVYF